MAAGGGECAYDILEMALAPLDLSGINFNDLENFALSTKENRRTRGVLVKQLRSKTSPLPLNVAFPRR